MSAVPLTRPPRLRPGDRVAVVTPAGPGPKDLLERGCALLRDWGLEVTVGQHVLDVSVLTCTTSPARMPTAPPTSRQRGWTPTWTACSAPAVGTAPSG